MYYTFITGGLIVFISTHVDDYVIATNDINWYNDFYSAFSALYEVKELGAVTNLLQMGIEFTESQVSLSQHRQIEELAKEYSLTEAKPMYSPMEAGLKLTKLPNTEVAFHLPFRQLLGALLWLARCTRPDIYYSVIYLSQFTNCYGEQHYKALKRILRYLITTKN